MTEAGCGFSDVPGGAKGSDLLAMYGPTILVNIGFDPAFNQKNPGFIPTAGITNIQALVDTGASESCIDSVLAAQLNLPIVDKRAVSGVHGSHPVNMHLAQVYFPALRITIWGAFAGVHLTTGGLWHKALIGRTFLKKYKMIYEGRSRAVTISSD